MASKSVMLLPRSNGLERYKLPPPWMAVRASRTCSLSRLHGGSEISGLLPVASCRLTTDRLQWPQSPHIVFRNLHDGANPKLFASAPGQLPFRLEAATGTGN